MLAGASQHTAGGAYASTVPEGARLSTRVRPASVAVHYDGNMRRNAFVWQRWRGLDQVGITVESSIGNSNVPMLNASAMR